MGESSVNFPSYINRFTKLGSLFRMWFNPLEKLLGNIVDYEDEYSYLDKLEPDRLFTNMG